MSRKLLVEGKKTFRITIPDEAKVTFGPWSPGEKKNYDQSTESKGTLRVYADKAVNSTILGVWSGVTSFREESLDFEEKTEMQVGSTVWKSDRSGYKKVDEVQREEVWGNEEPIKLADPFAKEE